MFTEQLVSVAHASEIYEDINLDKYYIPFLAIGMNGVYICIEEEDETIFEAIKKLLHLSVHQLFIFAINDNSFYDYASGYIKFDNIYDAFANCYENHLIPEADAVSIEFESASDYCNEKYVSTVLTEEEMQEAYITSIIGDRKITEIIHILEECINKPEENGRYLIYPDGTMMVKKELSQKIGALQVPVSAGEGYFPCSDMDGDKMFNLTLFGGLFGLHKFKTQQYLSGLGYFLTFGYCGVSYILDLISMIIGGYSYCIIEQGSAGLEKKKYFNRPVTKKLYAVVSTIIAAGIAYFAVRYIYLPLVQKVMEFVTGVLTNPILIDTISNKFS